MSLLRSFPAMAFALVLVAIVAFCVAMESFGLLVVAGSLAALSWYVTEGPRGRTLPKWVSNILLVAVVLNAGVDWMQSGGGAETMGVLGRFSLWLTIIKLYEFKSVRDYGHLLALSVVLVMAGCLQTLQLSFGLLLLTYVLLGLYVALLYQLHAGYEQARLARRAGAPSDALIVPPVEPTMGRRPIRQFRGLVVATALFGLFMSVVIFVIFPRGYLGANSVFGQRGLRRSGFGEDVSLMDASRISESRREVFSVRVLDPRGIPIEYPEPLHLRGLVLDQYSPSEGRWVASRYSRHRSRSVVSAGMDEFQSLSAQPIDERVQTYTLDITMRSLVTDVVFSMYAPISIAFESGRSFSFDPATLVLREQHASRVGRFGAYSVRVQPFATDAAMRGLVGNAGRTRPPTAFPIAAVREEALRILSVQGVSPDPPEDASEEETWRHRMLVARAFVRELQSPRFQYTTDLSGFVQARGVDPIVQFLTHHRFGHCEYFASAMTALCRSVGVEARLVTGFIALEFDDSTGAYIVRESNAHAWVEVQSGRYTWTTMDPTPADTLNSINDAQRSWADSFRWMWDRVEFMWNSRVVTFDNSAQATLAQRLNRGWMPGLRRWLEDARAWAQEVNARFQLGPAGYIWLGLVGVVLVIAIIAIMTVARRFMIIRRVAHLEKLPPAERRRLLRELGFYVDMLNVLHRGGEPKPEWQSPAHFAAELAERRPESAPIVADLVHRYYATRFGGEHMDHGERRRAHELVGELATSLNVRPAS